jgi:hypothetical protein
MKNFLLLPLAIIGLTLGTVSHSSAAISLLAGGSGSYATGATAVANPRTVLTSFNASTASKIVLTLSDEDGSGDTVPTGFSFGGVAMTLAVSHNNSIQQTKIYYLDASNPLVGGTFGTGDLVVNGTGTNDYGVSWLFLSGTADGVGPTNISTTQSVSLTTVVNGSWVIASTANNNASGTPQSPLTALLNGDVGSAGGGSGYAEIATAGAGTYSFTDGTGRPVTVAAAFAPIPEPSAALLGALGLLALLRRRR